MFTSSITQSDTMTLEKINAAEILLAISFKLQILIGQDTNFYIIFKLPKALYISFHAASCHVVNLVSFLVNGVFIPLTNLKKFMYIPSMRTDILLNCSSAMENGTTPDASSVSSNKPSRRHSLNGDKSILFCH